MAHTTQTVNALIIRENNVGEADRFITALTDELGVVRASARGVRNPKSRHAAATRLLCYSRLSLVHGRDHYIVDTAVPQRVFFDLFGDVQRLALAQYFCELAGVLAPPNEPAADYLRLLLNALHLLEQGRPPLQIKAVVELRALSLAGYMPDLTACAHCGRQDAESFRFSPLDGTLSCGDCPRDGALPVTAGVLAAMRHIVYGTAENLFSFRLGEEPYAALAAVSEAFMHAQLGRTFKTLSFFHGL